MNQTRHIILTVLASIWLQLSFSQQILFMDLVEQEPIADVEVTIFIEGVKKNFISDAVGIVKFKEVRKLDSLMATHASFEITRVDYKELSSNGFAVEMIPTTSLLPPMVIRGIPDDEEEGEVAIKIDRIKPAEVKFQNPQTAADVVGMNNKIYVQKSQLGGGSPMIRGFAANNILIVVDGVRMNNAIFRDGNLQNIISIDASMIEETEVFYGPGSVIYGSDAMGGVLAFQTKLPTIKASKHYKGNVMLRTASANKENSWHVDLEYGKGKFAGLSSISLSNYSNLKMGDNGPDEYTRPTFNEFNGQNDSIIQNDDPNVQFFTGYSQININQKFRYKPNQKNDIIFHFGYTTSSPINRYDRLLQTRNNQLKYGDWYYGPQKWAQFNIRYKHDFDSTAFASKMVITLALQQFEESRHDRLLFSRYLNSRVENVDAYTLNADFDKKIGKLDVMYGAEIVFNKVGSVGFRTQIDTASTVSIASRYPDQSTWFNSGIYLSTRYQLNKKSQLSAGIRYSQMYLNAPFDNDFYDFPFNELTISKGAVNGNLGINRKATKNISLFASVATGFRAPNIDDVGKVFDPEPGKVIVPNKGLLPEYSISGEIGINMQIGEHIQLAVNGYYTLVEDVIVRDNFTFNDADSLLYNGELLQVQSLVNADRGTIYGAEIQTEIKLHPYIKLKSSYNIISGQTSDDIPLRHVTPNFGNTSINIHYRRFRAQLAANYNAELPFGQLAPTERNKAYLYALNEDGLPYSPSWYTVNLKTGFYFSSSLKVNVGLENILNKRYRPYSSGLTAPGRNFILSINGRF